MITFLKKHTLYFIYSIIFAFILIGLWETSQGRHLGKVFLFFTSLTIFYFSLDRFLINIEFKPISWIPTIHPKYLIFASVFLLIGHYIQLGYIPIIRAINLKDANEIAWVRTNILSNSSSFFNYSSSILIKALIPFILLYSAIKNQKLTFILLSLIFSFYAFSLMQKSFIVTIFIPSIIYSIYKKNFFTLIYSCLIVLTTVFTIGYISNPHLKFANQEQKPVLTELKDTNKGNESSIYLLFQGLKKRVIITPGEMVSKWFDNIPEKKPFIGVDGYRIIAKIRNHKHIEYSKELYPIISKKYYDRGLRGTVNSASFMYEYANFGNIGLVISGLFLAIIFVIVESLFSNFLELKIALNFYPVIILSSSALTTLLFSGGWLIVLLLFFIFPIQKH